MTMDGPADSGKKGVNMRGYLKGVVLGVVLALALVCVGAWLTIMVLSKGVSFETPVVTIAQETHNFQLVGE
jgi:glycerol-3-phosphate acyltransferase PlsY